MKVASLLFKNDSFVEEKNEENLDFAHAKLVLGFGSSALISKQQSFDSIKSKFPDAQIVLSSSAGEIFGLDVLDNTISLVALDFSSSKVETKKVNIADFDNSFNAGKSLIKDLCHDQIKFIMVLSDGGKVNGSELVKGMNSSNESGVLITGGLAGDGTKFEQTFVGLNALPETGNVVAIAFYGEKLMVSHGSLGGWDSFGLERTVTKSQDNILFEIDHKSALDLYKTYLGKYAEELPGSALLFPLSINLSDNQQPIVRTILSVDESNHSMTFAGDLPVGSKVRFMKANFDRLIDAASDAASNCFEMNQSNPKLALLISCVGRKIILGNRIDEEVAAVSEIFGNQTTLSGFYSYGEISPLRPFENCELLNQTMTITGINEMD
ncbi:MAG: histidine kinase [Flavobacterium sp. BFFFF2]|nr:MAG: histidine kinase [Flavobacterium sp. BFFFF2]